jgi:Tfp pilus assembly protein PilF
MTVVTDKSSPGLLARMLRPAAIALMACAISLPLAAQVASTSPSGVSGRRGRNFISGTVRESDGQRPIESVEVQLWTLSSGMVASTFSNSTGNFAFADVPNGIYYLVVQEVGYERIRQEVNFTSRPPVGVQLMLRREAPYLGERVGDGPTVSTRELAIPRRAREAMERGLSLMNEKSDYKGSLSQFQRATREYAGYYEAYMQMGLAYKKMGDTAMSEQMLLISIAMSQRQYVDALFNLAILYSDGERFADAEPLAREAVELDPNSWEALEELARALHGLDQGEAAEAAALEARDIQPDNPQTYLLLANIHLKARNYTALIRDLDNYLQREPDGPQADQARQMRGLVFERMANIQPRAQ